MAAILAVTMRIPASARTENLKPLSIQPPVLRSADRLKLLAGSIITSFLSVPSPGLTSIGAVKNSADRIMEVYELLLTTESRLHNILTV